MLVDSFLDYLQFEKNYSEKTIISYRVDLSQFEDFVKNIDEGLTIDKADKDLIRQWMISLMSDKSKPYMTTSVNRKLSSLRSFFKFLLIKGIIIIDPTRKITGPKNKKPLPVFLRESEMNKLLDETDFGEDFVGSRDRLIIEMFYTTGMRLSELIGINDVDIDFSAMVIRVTGKRNKQRLIPFGEELKQSMKNYLDLRKQLLSMHDGAFFIREVGDRIKVSAVYELVKKHLSKVVTLKKRSPHVLRHTFATTMLNNDAELNAVKEILGHASLAATEVYTHTTFEELKKVYKQAHPRA